MYVRRVYLLPHAGLDGRKNCAGHHDAHSDTAGNNGNINRSTGLSTGGGKGRQGFDSQQSLFGAQFFSAKGVWESQSFTATCSRHSMNS